MSATLPCSHAKRREASMSYSELARARYSCRRYTDEPVSPADLEAIVEAGRIAPSAHNNHPSRIVVCDTPELREKAARAAFRFEKDGSVFGAPLVILICAVTEDAWVRRDDNMSAALIDTSIACDQMMMQATDLGLGTCWVCLFDPQIARNEFGLPAGIDPVSMLTVGHPADAIADPEKRAERLIPVEDFIISTRA